MRLILKTIRFSEAKRGIELTLKSADELFDDAEALSKRGSYSHAYFLLLTAYEELAKCLRIAEERAKNTATKNDLVLEVVYLGVTD